MISAIFSEMTAIATAFINFLVSLFSTIVNLFWTPGTGSEAGSLTLFGTLLLISGVAGLVFWALSFVIRLIRVRR